MWFCFRFCFLFFIFYLRVFDFLFPFLVLARLCFRKYVSVFGFEFCQWFCFGPGCVSVLNCVILFKFCDSVSRSFISGWRFVIVFWALLLFATVSSFVNFWLWGFVILFQEFLILFSLLCCCFVPTARPPLRCPSNIVAKNFNVNSFTASHHTPAILVHNDA